MNLFGFVLNDSITGVYLTLLYGIFFGVFFGLIRFLIFSPAERQTP